MLMGHALFNGVHDSQGGPRGGDKTFLAGMVMGMAQRPLGGGKLGFKVMLSPDPAMGKSGYPLLLATGETADGPAPWSTASTRTTSSWSCRPATAIRWAAASTAISMPACLASRPSAAGLHAPPGGHGQPRGADHPSLVRLDPHHLRRGDGGAVA
jgi:hypothetical protein